MTVPDLSPPGEFDERGKVLVVDDQASNRMLLHDMLEFDGHHVIEADDGLTALSLAAEHDPDVILLDVTMPGIDGFEVCRRLRQMPATAATPVLLVTALAERDHRLQGMSAGANDYLVKPIDRGEVSLRVRNAVRMRAMHRRLEEQFRTLQRLEGMRDQLVAMIAHDLRSPLTGLRGFLELLQEDLKDRLAAPVSEMLAEAIRSADQLNAMISDMLDVSRMEDDALPIQRELADLRALAVRAVAALGPPPSFHNIPVIVEGGVTEVNCDDALIERVLINLVANAVRFSPEGSEVRVSVGAEHHGATARVIDHGPGIPEAEQERIFEKFRQLGGARTRARSSGLGLAFCRMVVERHGGRIGVSSVPGRGSEFWFWLPSDTPA
jgi:two-component system sensor histidine kinase/response regulator